MPAKEQTETKLPISVPEELPLLICTTWESALTEAINRCNLIHLELKNAGLTRVTKDALSDSAFEWLLASRKFYRLHSSKSDLDEPVRYFDLWHIRCSPPAIAIAAAKVLVGGVVSPRGVITYSEGRRFKSLTMKTPQAVTDLLK